MGQNDIKTIVDLIWFGQIRAKPLVALERKKGDDISDGVPSNNSYGMTRVLFLVSLIRTLITGLSKHRATSSATFQGLGSRIWLLLDTAEIFP